jgi:CubicO group peptidase (beta-lactamase class C family)
VVLDSTIGFNDRDAGKPLKPNDVFCIMSLAKAWTAVAILNRIERGDIQLTTRVAEVIPEFGINGKLRITLAHLLTHTSGMPLGLPPLPEEQMGDLAANIRAICAMGPQSTPGTVVRYSASIGYTLIGEIIRRLDDGRRSFRQIMTEDFLRPLGMNDSEAGSRPDLEPRRVPVTIRDPNPNVFGGGLLMRMNTLVNATSEIPSGGALATAGDMFRFAEMLRQGGSLDGVRILSPAMVRLATTNHTGERPNNLMVMTRELEGMDEYPACLGLGFSLRGSGIYLTPFGTLASAGTFGALGIGSMVFWVDPASEISFVCLTAGLLGQFNNYTRFQRLSDLAHAALVDPA